MTQDAPHIAELIRHMAASAARSSPTDFAHGVAARLQPAIGAAALAIRMQSLDGHASDVLATHPRAPDVSGTHHVVELRAAETLVGHLVIEAAALPAEASPAGEALALVRARLAAELDAFRAAAARERDFRRYRSLFDQHSTPMLFIDADSGAIVEANPAASAFYGWAPGTLRHMRIQQINTLPPAEVAARMASVGADGVAGRFEFTHRCADGTTREVEVFSSRLQPTEPQERALLSSIVHDRTPERRLDQELRAALADASLARTEAALLGARAHLLDALGIQVWETRGADTYQAVNAAHAAFVGVSPVALIGRPFSRHLDAPSAEALGELHGQAIERRAAVEGELWVTPHRGQRRRLLVRVLPRPRQDGEIDSLIALAEDVTDRRTAEAALRDENVRLHALFDARQMGTWEWDPIADTLRFDAAYADMLGVSPADGAEGQTWAATLERLHPADREAAARAMSRLLAGEASAYVFEARVLRADGSWIWIHDHAAIVERAPDGERTRAARVAGGRQDVTTRKRKELALRARVAFAELLVNALSTFFRADSALLQADNSLFNDILHQVGEFVGVDRAYIFSLDPARATMSNTHEWCAPGIGPEIDNLQNLPVAATPNWAEALKRGDTIYIPDRDAMPASWAPERRLMEIQGVLSVLLLPIRLGERFFGLVGFDAVRAPRQFSGEDQRLLKYLSDNIALTLGRVEQSQALTRATEAAQRSAAEKDKASRAKSEFLASMSHEIRTPMNAILGFAQLLRADRGLGSAQRQHVETILRSATHLLQLIDDILDMSAVEAGRVALRPAPFSLADLLADLENMFASRAAAQGLALRVERAPDLPRYLRGDAGKLRQVLVNLLGNALKYTPAGTVTLRVRAAAADDGVRLACAVEDTGAGIPPSERERLFEAFQQGESGRRVGGTGLGLAISRRYVELMQGRIDVRSTVGVGSCFEFDALFEPATSAAPPHAAAATAVGLRLPRGESPVVLVADDHTDNRLLIAHLLRPLGFTVIEAADGLEALARFSETPAAAVLMDLRMPGLEGDAAIVRLRETPAGRAARVIAVTASAFEADVERVRAAGADACLRKPFQPGDLLQLLGRLLDLEIVEAPPPAPRAGSAFSRGRTGLTGSLTAPLPSLLPASLRTELLAAVEEGDTERMLQCAEAAIAHHAELGAVIRRLIQEYAYERLVEWLRPFEATPTTGAGPRHAD